MGFPGSVANRQECERCHNLRLPAEFATDDPICQVCRGEIRRAFESLARRMRRYKITVEEFKALLANGCSICGAELDGGNTTHIDHDHDTGAFRGLLCQTCNVGLGMFKDNADLLQRAADYVRNGSESSAATTVDHRTERQAAPRGFGAPGVHDTL